MSSEENVKLVEELFAALNAHDYDRYYGLMADDATMHLPVRLEGVDALRTADQLFFDAFPDHHRDVVRITADDRCVAAEIRLTGTHQGSYRGAPASGNRVDMPMCDVFEVRDGKVVAFWAYWDSALSQQQLSASEPLKDYGQA